MSGTLNKVMLIGYLGDDVKLHYFNSDSCVGRFPIATNETYINKETGEKVTTTEWHHIVVKNKAAEICEKYLSKGDRIYVEGKIRSRQWQAEDGSNKITVEILASDFTFLNTQKGNDGLRDQNSDSGKQSSESSKPNLPENDLPF